MEVGFVKDADDEATIDRDAFVHTDAERLAAPGGEYTGLATSPRHRGAGPNR